MTFNGTIRDNGVYKLGTHNGDIRVGLGGANNATIFVRTFQGDFAADFPVQLPEGQNARSGSKRFNFTLGSGSARIELQSFGGDIVLARKAIVSREDERQRRASADAAGRAAGAAGAAGRSDVRRPRRSRPSRQAFDDAKWDAASMPTSISISTPTDVRSEDRDFGEEFGKDFETKFDKDFEQNFEKNFEQHSARTSRAVRQGREGRSRTALSRRHSSTMGGSCRSSTLCFPNSIARWD